MSYADILKSKPVMADIAEDVREQAKGVVTRLDALRRDPIDGVDLAMCLASTVNGGSSRSETISIMACVGDVDIALLGLSTYKLGKRDLWVVHAFGSITAGGEYQLEETGHGMLRAKLGELGLGNGHGTSPADKECVVPLSRRSANLGDEDRQKLGAVIDGMGEGFDAVDLIAEGNPAADVLDMIGRLPDR